MKQQTALDILKTGRNVFLTGSAGSGKTHTLNEYINYLRARRVPVATTASTGIAATHMNGITIHSWSGIGIKDELTDNDLANLSRKQVLKERIKDTSVLIIDEISMLHAKQFNLVNQVLKHIRHSDKPFGGIQVVVAGDFFQLPPIGSRGESNRDKFAFMSEAWLEANFSICYLSEQHRQKADDASSDAITLDLILNQIRAQTVSIEAIEALKNTFYQNVDASRTRLYTHNINVNKINENELSELSADAVTYRAIAHGDNKLVETLKKSVRTSDELTLKIGAKVMFIKNNNELGVSNGTMGELIGFRTLKKTSKAKIDSADQFDSNVNNDNNVNKDINLNDDNNNYKNGKLTNDTDIVSDDDIKEDADKVSMASSSDKYPIIKLNTGREVIAEPEDWVIEDETGEVLASYTQIPLALAWAITIHKSQGMTLDAAEIDLSKTFELGQGYVALSRLKSLTGLKLLGMNDLSLRLDPLARGADVRFQELSEEAQVAFEQQNNDALQEAHDGFVLRAGGTINKATIKAFEAQRKNRQKKLAQVQAKKEKLGNQLNNHSESTLVSTRLLLEESLSIAEIAQTRGLAQSTIMGHIDLLKKQDPTLALDHIKPEQVIIDKVSEAAEAIIISADPNDFKEVDATGAENESEMFTKSRIKLRPIFEYLNEKIDYNTIRLALIFID